ncbi:trypsin-like serine peptidase [Streptomyces gamaensis]|uniref:Trypsin-like serine peptidase n=1 Tax=Streptomyces gamaensis TaxID=1763542 RepID=A0ABW0Z4U5_9ACTN
MTPRLRRGHAVLAVGTALALGACAQPATPRAAPFDGVPYVGVLLDDEGEHWCTASVVDSPNGNVLATAAHCVFPLVGDPKDGEQTGPSEVGLEFAPGFSGTASGRSPYGKWKVRGIHIDDRWKDEEDDGADYAFLTVEPDERGRSVQEAVGATIPDWSSGFSRDVTVIGYPDSDHNPRDRPVSCTTRTRRDDEMPGMMRMECAGFWGGTSGSPWLADHAGPEHPGRLIGVLSGGNTDSESTAALFDTRARALYEKAAREPG